MVQTYIPNKIVVVHLHTERISCDQLNLTTTILYLCIRAAFLAVSLHCLVSARKNFRFLVFVTIAYIFCALLLMITHMTPSQSGSCLLDPGRGPQRRIHSQTISAECR